MATAQDVANELGGVGNHHAAVMGKNGPSEYTAYSLQDKTTHAAKEVTLWLDGRSLEHEAIQKFLADPSRKDTTLGHAINAASLARVNHLILVKLAAALNVDISDIR